MGISSLIQFPGKILNGNSSVTVNEKPDSASLHYSDVLTGRVPDATAKQRAVAWDCLQQEMALVPSGVVNLVAVDLPQRQDEHEIESINVGACYIDRHPVTNREYLKFVESGCYSNVDSWPREIWQLVLQFTDKDGNPGPSTWQGGRPPKEKMEHPVVGISWYEAMAYARWHGKNLPTPAQWQRSASWHADGSVAPSANGESNLRYPWGNSLDKSKANLWSSGIGDTVDVMLFEKGSTPNGVQQLVGNVWEWVDGNFIDRLNEDRELKLAEVRGGAFDTYFESQSTTSFRTGLPLLTRANNVGFRCSLDVADLAKQNDR